MRKSGNRSLPESNELRYVPTEHKQKAFGGEDILMKLLTPFQLGNVTVRNRVIMPAMATNFGNPDGSVTERQIAYYRKRAAGGVGLIVVEFTAVSFEGKFTQNQLRIDHDRFTDGHRRLARAIHDGGAQAVLQLHHSGRRSPLSIVYTQAMGPSAIPVFPGFPVPRSMTYKDIRKVKDDFIGGAVNAQKAGYDAVEIHAAHGYLLSQFLSPESNRRNDDYGGTPEKRARLPVEILCGIKEALGADYPVIVKMTGDEYTPGGLEIDEALIHARLFAENGADMLCVSGSAGSMMAVSPNAPGKRSTSPPVYVEQACYVHLAEAVKKHVSIPVAAIGRINDPEIAERILKDGKADVIAAGRAHIADPDFVNKISGVDSRPLCRCIGCLQGCIERSVQAANTGITCAVNPAVGREMELSDIPVRESKDIIVVGGGITGMHAAAILAERGHRVALYEKGSELGGNVIIASTPPHKMETLYLVDYLKERLSRSGVEVYLNNSPDEDFILSLKPDTVIITCGAEPKRPSLPGMESAGVVTAEEVLREKIDGVPNGRATVVGGGLVGCETALYMAEKGWNVTVLEMLGDIAADVGPIIRFYLKKELEDAGIKTVVNNCITGFRGDDVVCCRVDDEEILYETDLIVMAVGYDADDSLYQSLKEKMPGVYVIGDAQSPRRILDAMKESFMLAQEIE